MKLNKKGQALVEYLLIIAVISVIVVREELVRRKLRVNLWNF